MIAIWPAFHLLFCRLNWDMVRRTCLQFLDGMILIDWSENWMVVLVDSLGASSESLEPNDLLL
jgi:hypothetical protein